jgi:hypothetical protein
MVDRAASPVASVALSTALPPHCVSAISVIQTHFGSTPESSFVMINQVE